MTPIGIGLVILLGLAIFNSHQLSKLKEMQMATKAEANARFDQLETALDKVKGETTALVQEVAELKEAANGENVSDEFMARLNGVADRVTSIDDLVADPANPSSSEVTAV